MGDDSEDLFGPWVPAPAASHLEDFRFSRALPGFDVRFRADDGRSASHYRYPFADLDTAITWWRVLTVATSPGTALARMRRVLGEFGVRIA